MTSELEKYHAGQPFCFLDPEIAAMKENALRRCREFNAIDPADTAAQREILDDLLGSHGVDISMQSPFFCDVGSNIHVGDRFLTNYNVTILDVGRVTIGDDCMIGPNTVISTVNHPIDAAERRKKLSILSPVALGNDVWIGANCTILPGVTLGDNVIVAAGAVVTKDVPSNSVVAGVPARVIRDLT